jgi:hypothetical protein
MRILHAAYDTHAAYDPHAAVWSASAYSLACGCIGSAFNEILPRSPHWLHGESIIVDAIHSQDLFSCMTLRIRP